MKISTLAGLSLLAAGLMGSAARAQAPRTVYLYNASLGTAPAGVAGAQLGPWGNGEIKPTRQFVQYEGAPVMEVTTKGFAEGARFDLKTPVDIDAYKQSGFIRLRLKFAQDSRGGRGGFGGGRGGGGFNGGGGTGGGFDGGDTGGGGFDGGGFDRRNNNQMLPSARWNGNAQFGALPPLGGDGQGGDDGNGGGFDNGGGNFDPRGGGNFDPRGGGNFDPRGGGNFDPRGGGNFDPRGGNGFGGPPPQSTAITELRVTLVRETGALVGRIKIDLKAAQPDDGSWYLFVLPISAMTQTKGASGPLQRVVLTSDKPDTFFMAQAALVVESGAMQVSIRPSNQPEGAQVAEVTVKPGPITLIADVEAGAADPQVEWNFDADNVGNLPLPTPPGGFPGGFGTDDGRGGDPRGGGFDPRGGGNFDPRGGGNFDPRGGGNFDPRGGRGGGDEGGRGGMDGGLVEITGPRVDARGLTATFTYPNEEQNYRVEVKVTDKSGKKEPVTASILVKVRG